MDCFSRYTRESLEKLVELLIVVLGMQMFGREIRSVYVVVFIDIFKCYGIASCCVMYGYIVEYKFASHQSFAYCHVIVDFAKKALGAVICIFLCIYCLKRIKP